MGIQGKGKKKVNELVSGQADETWAREAFGGMSKGQRC